SRWCNSADAASAPATAPPCAGSRARDPRSWPRTARRDDVEQRLNLTKSQIGRRRAIFVTLKARILHHQEHQEHPRKPGVRGQERDEMNSPPSTSFPCRSVKGSPRG